MSNNYIIRLLKTTSSRTKKLFWIAATLFILSGCINNPSYSPLDNISQPKNQAKPVTNGPVSKSDAKFHVVRKGQTIYSIALAYDLDYKALARSNGISSDYRIHPGQKLSLVIKKDSVPTASSVIDKTVDTTIKERPGQSLVKSDSIPELKLFWPVRGTIVRTSADIERQFKGIDIKREFGESVLAAAEGKVVFAGSGLRGYGNLIIIQHSEIYLTAYAYASEILVKENQQVQAGTEIAKVGMSGSLKYPALHFEVRKSGQPQDPLNFLP